MVTVSQINRWIRDLAPAKLLFDDEDYFASYFDQIEYFIKEKANESEDSRRFNGKEVYLPSGTLLTKLLTIVRKWFILSGAM